MNLLTDLDKKAVRSLETHLKTGYEKDEMKVKRIIQAIKSGKIGIIRAQDDTVTFEECCGELFNADINTDIDPNELKRQKANFSKRFKTSGCWTMITRYWTGRSREDCEGLSDNF